MNRISVVFVAVVLLFGVVLLLGWTFFPHNLALPPPKSAPSPASAPVPAPSRPNIVWVLLDACRHDHLSCYGYGQTTSPNIDGIARSGVVFENNYTQGLWTKLSVPAYMTGKLFPVSCLDFGGGENVPRAVPPDEKLLPEILRGNGYTTLCISAHPYISPRCRLYQAFDRSMLVPSPDKYPSPSFSQMLPEIGKVLDGRPNPGAPFFLYIHAMDTHFPHRAAGAQPAAEHVSENIRDGVPTKKDGCKFTPEEQEYLVRLHDTSIENADRAVGAVKQMLESRGAAANTVFVVSADHGDLLGEDGTTWGHDNIADPVLRTPLIMSGPGLPPGVRISALTRCVDILPTLLDMTGVRGAAAMQGVSLKPLIEGKEPETDEPVFSRAGVYELGGTFMLINRDHRYEYDAQTGAERVFAAGDAVHAPHAVLSGIPDETMSKYRQRMEQYVLPLWHAYTALPRLYCKYDFRTQFDMSWLSPADAIVTTGAQLPGVSDIADNRWTLADGTLWTANWAETAPPITLSIPVKPGTYHVSLWLNGLEDVLGHPGSSVVAQLNGANAVEATWTHSLQAAYYIYAYELGEMQVTDGICRITVKPGKSEYWSAVSGVGFVQVADVAPQSDGNTSLEEHREALKALGYVN